VDRGVEFSPYDYQMHGWNPYPQYAQLRRSAPVYRNEELDFWALVRGTRTCRRVARSGGVLQRQRTLLDPSTWGPDAHKMMSFNAMDPPLAHRDASLGVLRCSPLPASPVEVRIREIVRTHLEPALDSGSFDSPRTSRPRSDGRDLELIGVPADGRRRRAA